ncbi:MAG: hypothetical protein R8M46_06520 [Ghiorsea sp.]
MMKKILLVMMVLVLASCAGKESVESENNKEWNCKDLGGLLHLSQKCDQTIVEEEPASSDWGQNMPNQEDTGQDSLGAEEDVSLNDVEVAAPVLTIKEQMLAFDPSMYVVQVVSTTSKDSLDIFLGKNELFEKSYVRTWDKGQAWYVIVFGVFEGYSEAKRVSDDIPTNYRSEAWVRTAGSLQDAIRAFDTHQGMN